MSQYKFQRFPETLFKSPTDLRVVHNEAEAEAAEADGYKPSPSVQPSATEATGEVTKLRADLAAADELIGKLDEAGARVASERDNALKALDEAKAEIETLKAELAKADQGVTAENVAAIKAELADLGIEYDGRTKDPAKLAKILADAKAATDPKTAEG